MTTCQAIHDCAFICGACGTASATDMVTIQRISEFPCKTCGAKMLSKVELDSKGTVWNPEIHTGSKRKRKDGTWMPRRQGVTTDTDTVNKQDDQKTQYTLVHMPFVAEMAQNLQEGIKHGRERDDWKNIEWTPETRDRYVNALLRHTFEGFDAAAIACNAMIIYYHDNNLEKK